MNSWFRATKNSVREGRGFTLIEMLVAVGVFSLVMVISITAMVSVLDANAKAQAITAVANNLNIALESMSKSIRVGSNFHCGNTGPVNVPQDCPAGGDFFAFEPSSGDTADVADQIVYQYNEKNKSIERSINGGETFVGLTAPEVSVESLLFYVVGASADGRQPKVVISLRGKTGTRVKSVTELSVQTTVTQRLLDS